MTDTILAMRDITKEFPGVRALSDVNFDVQRGEIHSICGENGAGKSTLMKVLSGVHPHGTYSGQIFFEGEEVEFGNIRDSERAGIVIIHQELALIPLLSITENLFLGNEDAKRGVIDWLDARKRAVELLARVGLRRGPRHDHPRHRHRQAAAGRDRQGAGQGRQAAHPRRAHGGAQRGRQPEPAATAAGACATAASPAS